MCLSQYDVETLLIYVTIQDHGQQLSNLPVTKKKSILTDYFLEKNAMPQCSSIKIHSHAKPSSRGRIGNE